MRVLVCGGRDYNDADRIGSVLWRLEPFPSMIIHGCASGADTLAGSWAERYGVPVAEYPADWKAHGKGAGPIRNAKMLLDAKPDLVVAFPGGRGTADMVRKATDAGVPVLSIA